MDSSHRAPADSSVDRLATLRSATHGVSSPPRVGGRKRLLLPVLAAVFLLLLVVVTTRVVAPTRSPVDSTTESAVDVPSTAQSALPSGQALVAFAVKRGNFPPSLERGDVIRAVVTPGPDGSGDVSMIDDDLIVVDISDSSELTGDVVLTVRGREAILKMIAVSGPVHVALVNGRGEPE